MVKKNIAKPIIPPKLCTELMSVPNSSLSDGIEVNNLSGLNNLNALSAERAFPPPPCKLRRLIIYCMAEEATTKKSIQFQPSSRYEPESKAKPIAMHLRMNSK